MHLTRQSLLFAVGIGVVTLPPGSIGSRGGRQAGLSPASFGTNAVEHFLSDEEINYIRPGLNLTLNSVTIGADGKPVVDISFADGVGQPLDRAGNATPGVITINFVLSWWNPTTRDYTAYTTRTRTGDPAGPHPGEVVTVAGADQNGTWVDVGLGHATYTFHTVLPAGYDQTKTTTLGVYATRNLTAILNKNYYANLEYNFRPDGGTVTDKWDMIANAACNNCHDPISHHGGARIDIALCVLCHSPQSTDVNSGNTVNFKVMIHKIHRGSSLPSVQAGTPYMFGFGSGAADFSTVVFPQDIRNCTKCHAAPATQAANYMNFPSRAACGACHDNLDFATGQNHPGGAQFDDASCGNCHEPDMLAEWDPSVPGAHTVEYKSTQLHGLTMTILSVTPAAAGQKPVVTYQVKDKNGVSMDPRPFDTLRFTMGGPTTDYAVLPISENAQAGTSFDGTTATYTFQTAIPANATGTWAVTCDVELTVPLKQGDGKPDNTGFTESPLNPVFYIPITDAQAVPRRMVVDLANCNKCHDRLGLHGGQRLNTQGCVICHNTVNDDSSQRPADQGKPESISLQRMIHRIHSGTNLTQDYSIYGHGGRKVNFNGVMFPGDRRDCVKCHATGTQELPLALTNSPVTTQRDYYSPMQTTAAACLGCHDSREAAAHAYVMTSPVGEACASCHGAGDDFSVDAVHAR